MKPPAVLNQINLDTEGDASRLDSFGKGRAEEIGFELPYENDRERNSNKVRQFDHATTEGEQPVLSEDNVKGIRVSDVDADRDTNDR